MAPTTPLQGKTQTSPAGSVEFPFDVCALARAAGATFVARWTTAHPRQLLQGMKEGIQHHGFSFIEVMAQCPTQAGRYLEGSSNPAELFRLLKRRALTMGQAEKLSSQEMEGRFVIGKLHHQVGKKELTQAIYEKFSE